MSKNNCIEIFLRTRPTKKPFPGLNLQSQDGKADVFMPKNQTSGYVNNSKEAFSFAFNEVFEMAAKQELIFNQVAKEVVDSAIEGYNGTIFAYGQTGSGKTFTITGGAEHYEDRGVIPRTLAYIFSETSKRKDSFYEISVSYLEIYNNEGFDLLNENHTTKNLHDLPKVIPRETENEEIVLTGLSVHKAQNEEDALNLLFIGDTNRVVSETPKNDASTRSHCIFIIQIEAKKAGSDIKTVSRLHLVDLSGSERVGKTGIEGTLFKEATHINLSLHYLEHCIVCLNRRALGENIHVPYRNSLLTLVLRDSIGGNCKTRMIANISAEAVDMEESISTCRFASRVALIKNTVVRNESVDPALVIERLKRENEELKAELALLKGGEGKDCLDETEVEECKKQVEEYIKTREPGVRLILNDRLKINECFYHFKHLYNDLLKRADSGGYKDSSKVLKASMEQQSNKENNESSNTEEMKKLKLLIQQRDNEILILLNLINKKRPNGEESSLSIPVFRGNNGNNDSLPQTQDLLSSYHSQLKPISFPENPIENTPNPKAKSLNIMKNNILEEMAGSASKNKSIGGEFLKKEKEPIVNKDYLMQNKEINDLLSGPIQVTNEQLMDRVSCFEMFRKSYRKNEVMEEHKSLLKQKFEEGKVLGEKVNRARNKVNQLKNQIEAIRKEKAIIGLVSSSDESLKGSPEEEGIAMEIEKNKIIYKEGFDKLRDVKAEIERIQLLLEKSRDRMQKDFEKWLAVMLDQRKVAAPKIEIGSELKNLPKVSDKDLEKKLEAFYKARDEIYKNN